MVRPCNHDSATAPRHTPSVNEIPAKGVAISTSAKRIVNLSVFKQGLYLFYGVNDNDGLPECAHALVLT